MQLSKFIETALDEIQKGCDASKYHAEVLIQPGPDNLTGIGFDVPVDPAACVEDNVSGVACVQVLGLEQIDELARSGNPTEPTRLQFVLLVKDHA